MSVLLVAVLRVVCAAVDDLERLYASCAWSGRLADGKCSGGLGHAKRSQARKAPYVGNITLSAVSGVCICRPQHLSIAVSIDVTAEAHANNSHFTLSNPDTVVAGKGTLGFGVSPFDATGTPILE